VYYFRKNVDGVWCEFRLGEEEVAMLQTATMVRRIKAYIKASEMTTSMNSKGGMQIPIAPIFEGIAPTYDDLAMDYISGKIAEEKKKKTQG
jgi:hypothetical protein